jgi:hypothetical protein
MCRGLNKASVVNFERGIIEALGCRVGVDLEELEKSCSSGIGDLPSQEE